MSAYVAELYIPQTEQDMHVLDAERFEFIEALEHERLGFLARRAAQLAEEVRRYNEENYYTDPEVPLFANDPIGYQRRHLELVRSGASDQELAASAEKRLENTAAGVNEKMDKQTWHAPKPRVYSRGTDGKIRDGVYEVEQMFYNALSNNNPIEGDRRVCEAVNIAVIQAAPDTIPDVEEVAFIESSQCNHEKGTGGYVRELDKVQFRHSRYVRNEQGELDLIMQPVYVSGLLLTDEVITAFFDDTDGQPIDRTERLRRMKIASSEEYGDAIDFMRAIDAFASDWYKQSVFMGEFGEGDYSKIAEISEQRAAMTLEASKELDTLSMQLAYSGKNELEAGIILEAREKELMAEICKLHPGLARVAFDEATEARLDEVRVLEEQGRLDEAGQQYERAVEQAPAPVGCSDCYGIEQANERQKTAGMNKGLKLFEDGTLKADKERACAACSKKSLVYGKNGAVCTGCGSTKINGKVKKSKAIKAQEAKETKAKERDTTPVIRSVSEVEREHQERRQNAVDVESRDYQKRVA